MFLFFSGCITTAESVLITQQSQEELFKIIQSNEQLISEGKDEEIKTIIISISPQSRASIAARYSLTIEQVNTIETMVLHSGNNNNSWSGSTSIKKDI